jgi:hypothetical protein
VKEVDEVLHLDGGLQSETRPLWRRRLLVLKRRPPAIFVRIGHRRPECSVVSLSPMDGSLNELAWPNSPYSGMVRWMRRRGGNDRGEKRNNRLFDLLFCSSQAEW